MRRNTQSANPDARRHQWPGSRGVGSLPSCQPAPTIGRRALLAGGATQPVAGGSERAAAGAVVDLAAAAHARRAPAAQAVLAVRLRRKPRREARVGQLGAPRSSPSHGCVRVLAGAIASSNPGSAAGAIVGWDDPRRANAGGRGSWCRCRSRPRAAAAGGSLLCRQRTSAVANNKSGGFMVLELPLLTLGTVACEEPEWAAARRVRRRIRLAPGASSCSWAFGGSYRHLCHPGRPCSWLGPVRGLGYLRRG